MLGFRNTINLEVLLVLNYDKNKISTLRVTKLLEKNTNKAKL